MKYKWIKLGVLSNISKETIRQYNKNIGVYKAVFDKNIMYIGRAVEYKNGGFRKRINDYRRKGNSGRKHKSGRLMYQYRDDLEIYIIDITDKRMDEAVIKTKRFEKKLILKYKPEWNKHYK